MAIAITDLQREAKRQRDAAYRARKKAEASVEISTADPVVEVVLAPAVGPKTGQLKKIEDIFPKAETYVDVILKTEKGAEVEAPRGGMITYIVQKYRNDGARLLTGDGRQVNWDGMCAHPDTGGNVVYYEIVGGRRAGEHGWLHRTRGCNRIYQYG